jgi:hypothetical protein
MALCFVEGPISNDQRRGVYQSVPNALHGAPSPQGPSPLANPSEPRAHGVTWSESSPNDKAAPFRGDSLKRSRCPLQSYRSVSLVES